MLIKPLTTLALTIVAGLFFSLNAEAKAECRYPIPSSYDAPVCEIIEQKKRLQIGDGSRPCSSQLRLSHATIVTA